jgi:hypothetical protein
MHRINLAVASGALSLWAYAAGAVTVSPADAMGQVGHAAKVCGVVTSAVYDAGARAHPTFVTLVSPDQPSAAQALTAVVYGTDRAKFGGAPEMTLQGQRICVTGVVSLFRQRPEMILSNPAQVSYMSLQSTAQLH